MAKQKKEVSAYLRPRDNNLLTAYCFVHRKSKAEVLETQIRQIFAIMKEYEVNQLLKIYEGMTDQEKKFPKSF